MKILFPPFLHPVIIEQPVKMQTGIILHKLRLAAIYYTGAVTGMLESMVFIIIFLCQYKNGMSLITSMPSAGKAGTISAWIIASPIKIFMYLAKRLLIKTLI